MVIEKSLLIKEGHGVGGELMAEGQTRINYLFRFCSHCNWKGRAKLSHE